VGLVQYDDEGRDDPDSIIAWRSNQSDVNCQYPEIRAEDAPDRRIEAATALSERSRSLQVVEERQPPNGINAVYEADSFPINPNGDGVRIVRIVRLPS
jgi:hypothetical protein